MTRDAMRTISQSGAITFLLLSILISGMLVAEGYSDRTITSSGSSNGILDKSDLPLSAQNNTWRNASPANSPPSMYRHAMAYDSKRGRIVLFGGAGEKFFYNETWVYNPSSNVWTNVSPMHSPYHRDGHALTYDSESDRVVLFGGWTSNASLNDIWAYDPGANTWTEMKPKTHPPACYGHGMAYDSKSDRVILFGGYCTSYYSQATWAYDFNSNTWTQMNSTNSPKGRAYHTLVYDSRSDRIILFGGRSATTLFNETWSYDWDGNAWTNMTSPTSPPPRDNPSMAYDIRSDRVVLFGGSNGGTELDDTWIYDHHANMWVNATPSFRPPARAWSAMAYDPATDYVVLFGGYRSGYYLNDTWVYQLDNIPYVIGTTPSNGVLDISVHSDVLVSFSESMNETATERAMTVIPAIALNSSWSDSDRLLTLTPKTALSSGTNLTIRISTNATSADGKRLEHEFVLSFTIYAPAQPTFDVARTGVIILSIGIAVAIVVAFFSTEWIVYALALLLVPLYMKVSRDKMLSNFTRGRIYQLILNCPGAHLSFIRDVLNVPSGVLVHHLRMLEKSGMIRSIRKGYLKRFYGAIRGEITGMNNYGPLRDDIITVLKAKPGLSVSSLSKILSEGRQTMVFCVNSLLDKKSIIEKHTTRGARYYPMGPPPQIAQTP